MSEYSISIKHIDNGWQRLESAYQLEVVPESISHSHEMPGGPSTLSFSLKRDTRIPWPDLTPFTPVSCKIGGVECWSGRIMQTPTNRGDSSEIQVSAQGYWGHLMDDPIDRLWVMQDLSRFTNTAANSSAPVANYQGTVPDIGNGVIVLPAPQSSAAVTNRGVSVTFDAGPNNLIKKAVTVFRQFGAPGSASWVLYARISNSLDGIGGGTLNDATQTNPAENTQYTLSPSHGTGGRYLHLFWYWGGATLAALAADLGCRVESVKIFTDSADESGGASILKASTVISEALAAGGDSDFINTSDTSLITTTSYSIPEYSTNGRRSAQDVITDVNAYHAYQTYLTSEALPRLVYRAVPTTPTYIVNDADGYTFQDAGVNDASEIYNRVRYRYTNGDGTSDEVTSTPTTDTTPIGKRGGTRTITIEGKSKLSSGAAQQISDTYLAAVMQPPMKGSVTLKGYITRYSDGARIPVGAIQAGDVILLGGETDPTTGAKGRKGVISQINYSHDDLSVSITLDSTRNYIDALLARMGL